jgi:hypothetical protein
MRDERDEARAGAHVAPSVALQGFEVQLEDAVVDGAPDVHLEKTGRTPRATHRVAFCWERSGRRCCCCTENRDAGKSP